MHSSMMKVLKNAIHSNVITLSELQELETEIQQAIQTKRKHQQLDYLLSRDNFIEAIVAHGMEQNLPASAEHLRVAAEFLYDSEVLGMSPDEILREQQAKTVPTEDEVKTVVNQDTPAAASSASALT